MKMLSFAAVGFHGREWPRFAASAFTIATSAIVASAQPPDFTDLRAELAPRIATIAGPTDSVRVSCSENLRERACIAEIAQGDGARFVVATRPRAADASRPPSVAFELHPMFAQREPILDVLQAGERPLVLSPSAVTLGSASQPIASARVWPRDMRGRLQLRGDAMEAFLPGVTCRGTISPFALRCADEIEPWPIGVQNGGIAPSRNTFSTPEGLAFFDAANAPLMVLNDAQQTRRSKCNLVDKDA